MGVDGGAEIAAGIAGELQSGVGTAGVNLAGLFNIALMWASGC